MAFISQHPPRHGLPSRIAHGVASGFQLVARTVVLNGESEQRLNEARRLQALSDSDLAKRGLTRDRIVHHVFRDIFFS